MGTHWLAVSMVALNLGTGSVRVSAQEPDSVAVAAAERFIGQLEAGEWAAAEAMVSRAVRTQLGAAQLEGVWTQMRGQLGELKATRLRSVTPVDSLRAVELYGDFENQTVLLRVVMSPAGDVMGFWVGPSPDVGPSASPVPPYADRSKFREEEVSVGADPWRVPGTLTVLVAGGRHPAVVLVHGSGPHDRDETVGGTKVFRDLAWGLASRGVAVLRYEKRTKTHGARMGADVTVRSEVIDDAVAALGLVRAHPSVDPERVHVLGHSLGAQLAPEIARRAGGLAGAILLAAPARPIADLMVEQLEYLATLPRNASPEAQAQLNDALAQVRHLTSGAAVDSEVVLGAPVSYFRDLAKHDAVAAALRLDVPLLLLQGERDYQVTMTDFEIWRNALADRPATSLRSFPSLNHLFVSGSGPGDPAEYAQPGHVSADVIATIVEWIGKPQ